MIKISTLIEIWSSFIDVHEIFYQNTKHWLKNTKNLKETSVVGKINNNAYIKLD